MIGLVQEPQRNQIVNAFQIILVRIEQRGCVALKHRRHGDGEDVVVDTDEDVRRLYLAGRVTGDFGQYPGPVLAPRGQPDERALFHRSKARAGVPLATPSFLNTKQQQHYCSATVLK